jgi:ubiquitin-protein ligase
MNSRTRLFKELKDIQKNTTDTGIQLIPDESDIYKWQAVITVREQTHLAFSISYLGSNFHIHDHSL